MLKSSFEILQSLNFSFRIRAFSFKTRAYASLTTGFIFLFSKLPLKPEWKKSSHMKAVVCLVAKKRNRATGVSAKEKNKSSTLVTFTLDVAYTWANNDCQN